MVTFPIKVAALKDVFSSSRDIALSLHCRSLGDMQLCHSGFPQNGDMVLVAQKKVWFMEGSKGLKGDADWISEEQVPSALRVDPPPPRETSSEAQNI